MKDSFDIQRFKSPEASLGPVYTWDWNCRITKELINRQLCDMEDAGIHAAYIRPLPPEFRPGAGYIGMEPAYLSDAYFELLSYALDTAKARGMVFWLYDEGGWPSGSAAGRVAQAVPEAIKKQVRVRQYTLRAGETYLPCTDTLAAFSGSRRLEDGETIRADTPVDEYAAEAADMTRADMLDPRAAQAFLNITHRAHMEKLGERVGTESRVMFTDEPTAGTQPWPEGFADTFLKRYGYDIRDFLPALLNGDKELTEAEQHARIDCHLLRGELFRKNFLEPVRARCRVYGMALAGHMDNEDRPEGASLHGYGSMLAALRGLDIPGIDAIWRQIPSPGMKRLPDVRCTFFPRLASSAAHQNGLRFALSESFAIYGAGLTENQMRYIINYQAARGINLFNFMGIPSGRERAKAAAMRPSFTPEMPGYVHLQAINTYTARLSF